MATDKVKTPQFDASTILGVAVQEAENGASITFTDVPAHVVALFRRTYSRGDGAAKTAFLVRCIEKCVFLDGGQITLDGRLVPAPVSALGTEE